MVDVVRFELAELIRPDALVVARGAWSSPGPARLFDASVGQAPLSAAVWLRELVEEFAWGADLLVADAADITALWGPVPPLRIARRLRASGPGAVLVRFAAGVSVLVCADPDGRPRADGPGDVVIGLSFTHPTHRLQAGLAQHGVPLGTKGWIRLAEDPLGI